MAEDNLSHYDLGFKTDRPFKGAQKHYLPEFTPNDGNY